MNRKKLSSVDIAGITLGVLVILVVIGSVALLAQTRPFSHPWRMPDMSGFLSEETGDGAATREEKEDRVTGDVSEIVIRNIAGSINVRGSQGDTLIVRSVKTAMLPGALKYLHTNIQRNGGQVTLEEKHEGGFFKSAGTISFEITLPRGVKSMEVHSVSGSVTVADVRPGIAQKLSTISGSISTSMAADLDVSSTSGSIVFTFAGRTLEAHTVSGSIEGRVESLDNNGAIRVGTVSGSVDVDAYPGLEASVSLHSLSGGVSCDFPLAVTDQKRNALEGRIGSADGRLEVTTTSGPISIHRM